MSTTRATEKAAPYVTIPGTSSNDLGIHETVISTTPSLADVVGASATTSEVAPPSSFARFFNAGGMFNMFGRGFLAEPVLRDEEESYRYLMALDRY